MLEKERGRDKGGILALADISCFDFLGSNILPEMTWVLVYNIPSSWLPLIIGLVGKTVQMIATMAMNMPKPGEACRTTLIVVPAALLQQVDYLFSPCNCPFIIHPVEGRNRYQEQRPFCGAHSSWERQT